MSKVWFITVRVLITTNYKLPLIAGSLLLIPPWLLQGCSTGFGRHIALSALKRGDKVIATARNVSHLEALKGIDGLATMQLDVTDPCDLLKEKALEAEKIFGPIDVVVNNAGFGALGTLEELGYVEYQFLPTWTLSALTNT